MAPRQILPRSCGQASDSAPTCLALSSGSAGNVPARALGALEWEGDVRQVPGQEGRTTFVAHEGRPGLVPDRPRLPSLLGQGSLLGRRGNSDLRIVTASQEQSRAAPDVEPRASVLWRRPDPLADATPISLEHVQLPAAPFPRSARWPAGGVAVRKFWSTLGVRPAIAQEAIEVVSATRWMRLSSSM